MGFDLNRRRVASATFTMDGRVVAWLVLSEEEGEECVVQSLGGQQSHGYFLRPCVD